MGRMPDSGLDPAIQTYYDDGREQSRLEMLCRLEFLRTRELLARFLPPPPARVVDVGGGAGIHALALMERGYEVHLIDPIPLHATKPGPWGFQEHIPRTSKAAVAAAGRVQPGVYQRSAGIDRARHLLGAEPAFGAKGNQGCPRFLPIATFERGLKCP